MRYQVLVDSRDRDFDTYPAPNAYRVRLPRRFTNVVGARLLSADIPLSFLVFQAQHGNTSLAVTVGGSGPQTVTIPDGNYDDQTMVEELRTALAAAFPGKDFLTEVDARTYQLVVTCVQGDPVAVDTTAAPDDRTDWGLAYYLGFPKNTVTSGAPLRAPGTINLNPFTYVLMDIEELGVIDEGGMYGTTMGRGCLCKIPIQGVSYEYIFRDIHSATDMVPTRALVPRLDSLTVTFRLHDNRTIDFRGVEHSFLLEIETRDRVVAEVARPTLGATRVAVTRAPRMIPKVSKRVPRPRLAVPPPPMAPTPRRVPRSVYLAGGVTAAGLAWWWWRRSQ